MQQTQLVADEEEMYEFKDDEFKTDPLRSKNKSDSPEAVVPSESPEIPGYILLCLPFERRETYCFSLSSTSSASSQRSLSGP